MDIPNWITLSRILAVPLFLGFFFYWPSNDASYHFWPASIFTLACVSDALDGFWARISRRNSKLGALMDPLADKLLLVSAFLALTFTNGLPPEMRIPAWLSLVVISRDAMLIAGFILICFVHGPFVPKPNIWGKLTTFTQMALIWTALLCLHAFLLRAMITITAILTLISGAVYLHKAAAHLAANSHPGAPERGL